MVCVEGHVGGIDDILVPGGITGIPRDEQLDFSSRLLSHKHLLPGIPFGLGYVLEALEPAEVGELDRVVSVVSRRPCVIMACFEGRVNNVGLIVFRGFFNDRMRDDGLAVFVRVEAQLGLHSR